MIFTTEEKCLLALYRSSSAKETAAVMREALPYIDEPDVRTAAENTIRKLGTMSEVKFENVVF